MPTYQTLHTNYGLAAIAAATASGVAVNLTQIAVGDGNGFDAMPSAAQVALVREVYRAAINVVRRDPVDSTVYYIEMVIPAATGGWTIREFGVFDDTGSLFAVGNFPATYKSVPTDGAVSDLVIQAVLVVSNAGVINITLDPNVAIASRQWVINNITPEFLLPGGTTGQVLRKRSNINGDTEWANPASATILVNIVEEPPQAIAASQLTVTLVTTNTTGLAVYINGLRIPRTPGVDGWLPSGATQVVLGKQYTVGAVFTAFQNDPANHIPDPLTASLNLSDVQSAATARANLDVYSRAEVDASMPAGTVVPSARATAPPGWLLCDGAAVSRTTYARLFSAIGTLWGGGDGTTTFNVPELRGEALRFLDVGRGVDVGRAPGSAQSQQIPAHKHVTQWGERQGGTTFGRTNTAGKLGSQGQDNDNYWFNTNDGSEFDGAPGNPAGLIGAEVRMRNVALLGIIKT